MDLRDDDERISHLKIIEGYQHSEYNRFICGCLETLKIENIREKIIEFYNEFYIPENMSLTVISNLSIEKSTQHHHTQLQRPRLWPLHVGRYLYEASAPAHYGHP